jgi:ABC-type transporter Mla subunit MlaD
MKNATWKDLLGLKDVRNFLTGAVLLSSLIVFSTASVAYLLHNDFLERKYTVYALFEDATGMSRGAKVLLNGVQIGSVKAVRLTSDARVVLVLDLQLKYQSLIRRNSAAYFKRDRNLVSDRVLNIEKGDPRSPVLLTGDTLVLGPPQDIETALGSLASLTTQFRNTLVRVDSLLELVTDTNTTIGAVLVKDDLYRRTLRTVESIDRAAIRGDRTIQRIDQLGGVVEKGVPRLFEQSDSLASTLQRTASNADTMSRVGLHLIRRGDTVIDQVQAITANGGNLIDRGQGMLDAAGNHWLVGRIVGGGKKPPPSPRCTDSAKN